MCSSDLDVGLYFLRDELKFNYVTRFISFKLKDLIYIIDNILKGGKRGFGLSAPPWTAILAFAFRSEERRVGKECRSRWSPYH